MRLVSSLRCFTSPLRADRPIAVALLAACTICPANGWAQSTTADDASRINVWGVADTARDRSVARLSEPQPGDSAPQPQLVSSVSLQQSQWGGASVAQRRTALDGAARPETGALSAPAAQATDVSYRWGLGTARGAVDVGIGASAYRVRFADSLGMQPARSSLAGPGAESRRDALVPTLSVGLRHSLSDGQRLSVYAGGSASVSPASVGEFYATKVKVEWLPTRNSSIGFEHAAVNMRFGPTSNIALRVRHGGPMIYYRSTF